MGAPRWEYRIWQQAPPPLPCRDIEDRTDLYLLRTGLSGRMVKLRDARLDVKELIAQEDGLQCWQPRPKLAFPLGTGPVAAALCLACDERRRLGQRHDSPAALAALLDEGTATRVVPVRKRRSKSEHHGCAGETVQVAIGDLWYGCQALEDADPEHLHAAIVAMGWPQGRNESYVERLMREPDRLQPAMALSSQRRP